MNAKITTPADIQRAPEERIVTAQTGIDVESSRAIANVQAAMIVAKRFPRNYKMSRDRMMSSCKRLQFAERSLFIYKRGNTLIEGPTIRLAECLATAWGNLDFGFKMIDRVDGGSIIQAFCYDLETNLRITREVFIADRRFTGGQALKSDRDVMENMTSVAQRVVRSVVLECIPVDFVDTAVMTCRGTLERGDGTPLQDRVDAAITKFAEIGIDVYMIESFLGHNIDSVRPIEMPKLQAAYQTISSGMARAEDLFPYRTPPQGNNPPSRQAEKPKQASTKKSDSPEPREPTDNRQDPAHPTGDGGSMTKQEIAAAEAAELAEAKKFEDEERAAMQEDGDQPQATLPKTGGGRRSRRRS